MSYFLILILKTEIDSSQIFCYNISFLINTHYIKYEALEIVYMHHVITAV